MYVQVTLGCIRTDEALDAWRLRTWQALRVGFSELLFGWVVHRLHLFVEGSFVNQIPPLLPRTLVPQGAMWALVVIVVLPLPELFTEARRGQIDCRVKLFPVNFRTPFHFPVEMRRPRFDRAKLDRAVYLPLLEVVREELHPTVGLDTLDWEWQLFDRILKEINYCEGPLAHRSGIGGCQRISGTVGGWRTEPGMEIVR
jgi:hypothetical protein